MDNLRVQAARAKRMPDRVTGRGLLDMVVVIMRDMRRIGYNCGCHALLCPLPVFR
jgi:hypothetical protein